MVGEVVMKNNIIFLIYERLNKLTSREMPKAFTLIELLVVVFIMGVLIALSLPAVHAAREAARRTQCASHLKQLGIALHDYHTTYSCFPAGERELTLDKSWLVDILPFVEQQPLYASYNSQVGILFPENSTVQSAYVSYYACPDDAYAVLRAADNLFFVRNHFDSRTLDRRVGYSSYCGNYGTFDAAAHIKPTSSATARPDGVFSFLDNITYASVIDGLSSTMFATERATSFLQGLAYAVPDPAQRYGWYMAGDLGDTLVTSFYPPNLPKKIMLSFDNSFAKSASSLHPSGVNVLLGDGSVRLVKDTISSWRFDPITGQPYGASMAPGGYWSNLPPAGVWQHLSTRQGGELIGVDSF